MECVQILINSSRYSRDSAGHILPYKKKLINDIQDYFHIQISHDKLASCHYFILIYQNDALAGITFFVDS